MQPKDICPKHVCRSEFMNSMFQDAQMEMFLRCIAITQKRLNPDAWTPFSWAEYVARCDHKPIETERRLLEAMVSGGNVILTSAGSHKTVTIRGGYLTKDGDGRYVIAEPLLKVMAPYATK